MPIARLQFSAVPAVFLATLSLLFSLLRFTSATTTVAVPRSRACLFYSSFSLDTSRSPYAVTIIHKSKACKFT